jgi:glycosyltransferase involved in cell wall biosynthesis
MDRGNAVSFGLVSILIPCYNTRAHVAVAIESALAQRDCPVEVVVVDDGSTDDSAEVIAPYRDRIVYVQQPNRGLSAARNAAMAAASGEYFLLLDADDILLPHAAASRREVLERDPEIGLVAGWFREIDAEGVPIDRTPEKRTVWPRDHFRQCVRRNWGPPVGWTFRRSVVEQVGGFDPFLKSCEDWDFVIRVSRRFRIGYVPESHVLYRKAAGQMSSNYLRMLDAAHRVYLKNRAIAPNAFLYWIDGKYGQFELGRRILYAVLFEGTGSRLREVGRLVLRQPHLLWVGALSAVSYLLGKRPSMRSAR